MKFGEKSTIKNANMGQRPRMRNKVSKFMNTRNFDVKVFFTSYGRAYQKRLVDGETLEINSSFDLDKGEKVLASSMIDKGTKKYVVFVTKTGRIKKMNLSDFDPKGVPPSPYGVEFYDVYDETIVDEIVHISIHDEDEDPVLVLITDEPRVSKISLRECNIIAGKIGRRAVLMEGGTKLLHCFLADGSEEYLALFDKKGGAKKILFEKFKIRKRGKAGGAYQGDLFLSKGILANPESVFTALILKKDDEIIIERKGGAPTLLSEKDIPERQLEYRRPCKKNIFDPQGVVSIKVKK